MKRAKRCCSCVLGVQNTPIPLGILVLFFWAVVYSNAVAQFNDWTEGAHAEWNYTSQKLGQRSWESPNALLRIFDKVAPIDTVSIIINYPEPHNTELNKPAIIVRIDGFSGVKKYLVPKSKAFYRTTTNKLAANESDDTALIDITAFDSLSQTIAGTFDYRCTYTDADGSSKVTVKGKFSIRGFTIEPTTVVLAQGEDVTYKILTSPDVVATIQDNAGAHEVTADARGIATFAKSISSSHAGAPESLVFATSSEATAGKVSRTIYIDTSFAKALVLPMPSKAGFQVQSCKTDATLDKQKRRIEFHRPDKFRLKEITTTDSTVRAELWRLPIDSVYNRDTLTALAGITVQTEEMLAVQHTTDLLNQGAADSALAQWIRTQQYKPVGTMSDDSVAMKIQGGVYNGKTVQIPCRRQRFEKEEERQQVDGSLSAQLHTQRGEALAFNWGIAPAGVFHATRARGIVLLSVKADITTRTSDSTLIALNAAGMLQQIHAAVSSAKQAGDSVSSALLNRMKDSLQGAVPEYLLLYDFSGDYTVSPDSIDNINQFDRGISDNLPQRFSYQGGNACGASSLTMALSALLPPADRPTLEEVYHNTLQIGLHKSDATTATVPSETAQSFLWERATRWLWGDTVSIGICLTNTGGQQTSCRTYDPSFASASIDSVLLPAYGTQTWADADAHLLLRQPMLIGTYLGTGVGVGGGHVVLMLGKGSNPQLRKMLRSLGADTNYYIVADPAGHFYANPNAGGMNTGHYGLAGKLDSLCIGISHSGWFGVYPQDAFRLRAGNATDTRYTLSFFNDSSIVVRVRSGCTYATNCATNGIGRKYPDILAGTAQEDVPAPFAVYVVDPDGKKAGMNADGSILTDIPRSQAAFGLGEEESNDEFPGSETAFRDAVFIAIKAPKPGTYTLQIEGLAETAYDIDIVKRSVAETRYERKRVVDTLQPTQQKDYPILVPSAVWDNNTATNNKLLRGAFPEPFSSETTIEFVLVQPQHTRLVVLNSMGVEVAVVANSLFDAGVHRVRWNADAFPTGVYFCRLETSTGTETHKLMLIK